MNMATATETRRTITKEAEHESPLDAAIAATGNRTQSIRADAAKFLGVPPEKVCDLLSNVWAVSKGQPPLTNSEMFVGMSMIARFGLDPIAKEVYVTRSNKGLMTIIGIDGFIKILDRTEHYDGFDQEIGWNATGDDIEWVETKIYSTKRKRPTVYRAYAKEYARLAGIVAKAIPWHMLRLFSLRHATRLFTPLGGVVTEEEARWMREYTPDEQRRNAIADHFEAELEKAKAATKPEQKSEPTPEPEATEMDAGTETTPTGDTLFPEQSPPADGGPGPEAAYYDALPGCETQFELDNLVQQAKAAGQAGELTSQNVTDIEAAAKRRARELKRK